MKILKLLFLCTVGCSALDAIIIQTIVLENKNKHRIVLYGDMHVDLLAKKKKMKEQKKAITQKIQQNQTKDHIFFIENAPPTGALIKGLGIFLSSIQNSCDTVLVKNIDPRRSFTGIISFLMQVELSNTANNRLNEQLQKYQGIDQGEIESDRLAEFIQDQDMLIAEISSVIKDNTRELLANKKLIDKYNHSFYSHFSYEVLYQALYEGVMLEIEKLKLICKRLKQYNRCCCSIKNSLDAYENSLRALPKDEYFAIKISNLSLHLDDLLDISAKCHHLCYSNIKKQIYIMGEMHIHKLAQWLQAIGYVITYNSDIVYPDGSKKTFDAIELCTYAIAMGEDAKKFPGIKMSDFDYID